MKNNSTMDEKSFLKHRQSKSFLIYRLLWQVVRTIFILPVPGSMCNSWKTFWLRLFGAKIGKNVLIYSNAKIYNPSKLIMDNGSVLGPDVDCYNVDFVHLGKRAIISQKAYLCTASHDIDDVKFQLITKPITIGEHAWVAADSFVGMGVTIGKNAVIGARSSVFKDVPPNVVVGGNPARILRNRKDEE